MRSQDSLRAKVKELKQKLKRNDNELSKVQKQLNQFIKAEMVHNQIVEEQRQKAGSNMALEQFKQEGKERKVWCMNFDYTTTMTLHLRLNI